MAVVRRPRDGALLVSESDDPLFQRPLGGHVEFGEYALDTVRREFGEEIGQDLTDVRLLGVLENIFGWRGGTEHEVVFIFTAAFASATPTRSRSSASSTTPTGGCCGGPRRAQPAAVPGRAERADRYPSGRSRPMASAGVRVRLLACGALGREVPVSTGPGEWAGQGRMRAGHADRERVITELKAAFVQGRLDKDELEERAGRAVVSRTSCRTGRADRRHPRPSIPAGASTAVPAATSSPGRTLARAAKRAGICMLAAVALAQAAFLVENILLMVVAFFAAIAAGGFLGYGILDAIQERHARDQPTLDQGSGSGQGLGGPGSAGVTPARGLVPPGGRADQTLAEARARRPRPAGGLQRGWAVS